MSTTIDSPVDDVIAWGRRTRGWADETCRVYAMYLHRAVRHTDRPLVDLGRRDASAVLDAISSTAPTRILARKALRAYYDYVVDHEDRDDNPVLTLPVPKRSRSLPKALTDTDAEAVMAAGEQAGGRVAVAVLAAFRAGLRASEIAGLGWDGIDGDWLRIRGKGGYTRSVPVHPRFAAAVEAWRPHCPDGRHMLPSPDVAGPVRYGAIRRWIRDVGQQAGIDGLIPHVGRHTYATQLLDATGSIALVQAALGHSNPATTMIYAHVRNGQLADAVNRLA